MTRRGKTPRRGAERRQWLAAGALIGLFAFTGLGNHPLRAADETRVAGIAWEMQQRGEWLVPHLGGEVFVQKPPLGYAAIASSIRLLGNDDFAARLASAVAAALTLLLVFDWARRAAGTSAGLLAICVCVSLRGFFRYSHKVLVDPWLALFVVLGFWAYVRASFDTRAAGAPAADPGGGPARPHTGFLLLVYAAAALACFVKGPVGVVSLTGPIGVDVLWFRRWSVLRSRAHWVGVPLLLLGIALWPAYLYFFASEAVFREFFVNNLVGRIAPGLTTWSSGHEEPAWYYLAKFPEQITWLTALLPAMAVCFWRGALPERWSLPSLRFAAMVFPVALLLMSLPGTKRTLYLLPFLPALAVAAGAYIAWTTRAGAGTRVERVTRALVSRTTAWLLARAGSILLRASSLLRGAQLRAAAARLRARAARLAQRAVWHRGGVDGLPTGALASVAAAAYGLALAWNLFVYPWVGDGRNLGPVAREVAALHGTAQPLAAYQLAEEMRGALPFYTGLLPQNLHTPAALVAYARAHPGALLLQGNQPVEGFPGDFAGILRHVRSWPKAEGAYALYAIEAPAAAGATRAATASLDDPPAPRDTRPAS